MATRSRRKRTVPAQKPSLAATSTVPIAQWWSELSHEHRKGYSAIAIGFFTCIITLGMSPYAQHSWIHILALPFQALFGWATILMMGGTIISCILLIAEVVLQKKLLSLRWVFCSVAAIFFALVESSLLFGPPVGGFIGDAGALLLSPIPPAAIQILIIGAYILDTIVAFQLSWSTLRKAAEFLNAHWQQTDSASQQQQSAHIAAPFDVNAIAFAGPLTGEAALLSRKQRDGTSPDAISTYPIRSIAADVVSESQLSRKNDAADIPAYLRQTKMPINAHVATAASSQEFVLPPLSLKTMADATLEPVLPSMPQNRSDDSIGNNPSRPIREITGERPLHSHSDAFTKSSSQPIAWTLPPLTLLTKPSPITANSMADHVEHLANVLERTLRSFGVDAEVRRNDISAGPTVIRFGIRPLERMKIDDQGRVILDQRGEPMMTRTRVSRIMNLKSDLALVLEAKSLRMEAPVPERPFIGLEIPNVFGRMVLLREILESREFRDALHNVRLPIALGRDVAGRIRIGDLAKFPHMLIAGATGSGKSVCLNTIICSLITHFTPYEVKFLMIDPKMVELTFYEGIPHLLSPVITDPKQVVWVLDRILTEMERRYHLFAQVGVRNLEGYQAYRLHGHMEMEQLPCIVVIIDELADLMMLAADEVERQICRLAQLARATGIHLVVATQRPSVDVVTGLIKANIPTRIAFMVSSSVDSRTIIDGNGAEQLLGKGDSLFLAGDVAKPERIQSAFIADEEVERLATFWRQQCVAIGVHIQQWSIPANDHN